MKKREKTLLNFAAALLGVFEVDWEKDFDDDGYRSVSGRAPLEEALFFGERDNILPIPARRETDGRAAARG